MFSIERKAVQQAVLISFGKIVLARGGGRCAPVINGATSNNRRRKEWGDSSKFNKTPSGPKVETERGSCQ